MRIIHVTDTSIYNFDGISTYINELLEVSEQNNDEILILTTTPHGKNVRSNMDKYQVKTFPCLRFPGKPKFITVLPFQLKKTIEAFNPDLIWIHTIGTLGTQAAKASEGKYNMVYTKHCFDGELWCSYLNIWKSLEWILHNFADYYERIVLKRVNRVVYHLTDKTKIMNSPFINKFLFIPPPLNTRFFKNRKHKSTTSPLVFGFCGRGDPDKGLKDTFDALEIFRNEHPDLPFEFLLIGDGSDAHLMKHNYPNIKITITGYVEDVIPYLDTLDAFIFTSKHETISLSSLEAYVRGIPIFTLPIGYLSEHTSTIQNYFPFNHLNELSGLLYKKFGQENQPSTIVLIDEINPLITSYHQLYNLATQ